jgi:peptidoglycan/LPS O-acetylase OafA/YrhL
MSTIFTKTNRTKKGKTESHLRWWVTLLLSLALAIGTWNPLGHHFIHYLTNSEDILSGFTPFAILIMIGLWILAFKSILQSIGVTGAIATILIILAFIWGLNQYGWLDFSNTTQMGWVGTISVGFIIWIGINASIIWKTITGVYATDVVDTE